MKFSYEELKTSVDNDISKADTVAGDSGGNLSSPVAQSNFHLQRANVYAILMVAESIQRAIEAMKKGNLNVVKKPTKSI